MAVTIRSNARGWREVSSTVFWTARCVWDTGSALYAVVQDTGATPKVRVMKADSRTAPTSWSEQDSGNNKTITNVDYPYTSWLHTNGDLHVVVFTATNTITHYLFDTDTDAWGTGLGSVTASASNERLLRFVVRPSDAAVIGFWTSSTDDADLRFGISTGGAFTAGTHLSINSTEASSHSDVVPDGNAFSQFFYLNCVDDDFIYRSHTSTNTFGTASTIDAAISTDETTYSAGGRFNLYDDAGTDKVIAAYIDDSGLLYESVVSLETSSDSTDVAANVQIEGTATDVGTRTPISTAVIASGTPYAAWWDDASSGTIKYSTKSGGTWAAETNFATSITRLIEIVPVSPGLMVVYQSGTDVVMDWIVAPVVGATGTVSSGTLSVGGQTVTATTGAVGSVATGTLAVAGQSITGTPTVAGNVGTGSHAVSGQTVAATTGVVATVNPQALAVAGQTVTASTGVVATVGTGSLAVTGQTMLGVISDTGIVTTGSHAVSGQTVTATTGVVATVTTGTHAVSGQMVNADPAVAGNVSTGSHAIAGQTVSATTGVVAVVTTGSHTITGQTVTGMTGTVATVSTGSLAVSGQTVTSTTGVVGVIGTGSLAVDGQSVVGEDTGGEGETGTISTGTLSISGQTVSASTGVDADIGTGTLAVSGQTVTATTGVTGQVDTGNLAISGQTVAATTGTVAVIDTGTIEVSGQTITATELAGDETGTILTGEYVIEGQVIIATPNPQPILTWGVQLLRHEPRRTTVRRMRY